MKAFFLSLKTTIQTLSVLIILFFIGSYLLPNYPDVFDSMNNLLLIEWAAEKGLQNPWQTWWFFCSVIVLILLTINTIACSLQAVKTRWPVDEFLLRISPQIVHIGFLFILLAHLIGALWGYRLSGLIPEGATAILPEDRRLYLADVRLKVDEAGYIRDWSADVHLFEKNKRVKAKSLGPNSPLFYKGMGVYLKNIYTETGAAAVIMVNRDPGAIWALIGAVLFGAGSVMILILKWKNKTVGLAGGEPSLYTAEEAGKNSSEKG